MGSNARPNKTFGAFDLWPDPPQKLMRSREGYWASVPQFWHKYGHSQVIASFMHLLILIFAQVSQKVNQGCTSILFQIRALVLKLLWSNFFFFAFWSLWPCLLTFDLKKGWKNPNTVGNNMSYLQNLNLSTGRLKLFGSFDLCELDLLPKKKRLRTLLLTFTSIILVA